MKRPAKSAVEIIKRALLRGKTNAEVLAIYKRKHPHSTYSPATVNWYRNKFRAEGLPIPSERDCRAKG